MNQLNSIILEGNVVKKPRLKKGTVPSVELDIDVHRYTRDAEGNDKEIVYTFPIVTYGLLAESTVKYSSKGRGIRVVGRLVRGGEKIQVLAEHIEWKPKATKKVQK